MGSRCCTPNGTIHAIIVFLVVLHNVAILGREVVGKRNDGTNTKVVGEPIKKRNQLVEQRRIRVQKDDGCRG